jgi:hypothetical protein
MTKIHNGLPVPQSVEAEMTSTPDLPGFLRPFPEVPLPVPFVSHEAPLRGTLVRSLADPSRRTRIDRMILRYCLEDFVLIHGLLCHVPRGTLYRHVATLLNEGCLAKRGRAYRATVEGRRRLAEADAGIDWACLATQYLPLALVPTAQHRTVIELILSAMAARRADLCDDHHPAFVLLGPTLAWKTSTGRFIVRMLGLEDSEVILDLATESERSVWLRRDARGTIVFTRNILASPFLVFDDILEADAKLRASLHHFLSGRKVVPVENGCVTLNPRMKSSLEARTTWSPAQLRRMILCDLDRVPMPDLALTGHMALDAVAQQPPFELPPLRHDCRTWRPQILRLLRAVLTPEGLGRVDSEMVIQLCSGMTALIEDPERAIQQTVYDFALTSETLGWTQPDWLGSVSSFTLQEPLPPTSAVSFPETVRPPLVEEEVVTLRRHIMSDAAKESLLPPFSIAEDQKAKLLYFAMREQVSPSWALEVLLEYYVKVAQSKRSTLDDLHSIVELSKELKLRTIPVKDLEILMRLKLGLQEKKLKPTDLDPALDLLGILQAHGLKVGTALCEQAIALAARLLTRGVPLPEMERRLAALASDQFQSPTRRRRGVTKKKIVRTQPPDSPTPRALTRGRS